MKKLLFISLLMCSLSAIAQSPIDALMYSRYYSGGTARFNAMSGAFGALGGDFSTLSNNPAGIGVYRTSEFVFTTGFNISANETQTPYPALDGSGKEVLNTVYANDNHTSINIGNIGYIGTWRSTKSDGLVSINWGIGLNRLHDFNRNSHYKTINNKTSLTDVMAREAGNDKLLPDNFNQNAIWSQSSNWRNVMGWDTYLIDYNGSSDFPFNSILLGNTTTNQDKFVTERGSINEWAFSMGGNISHKLYFGATLGIQSLYYSRHTQINEVFNGDLNDGVTYMQYDRILDEDIYYKGGSFSHNEFLKTTGTGINFKTGVIYRPVSLLRLGLAIHTPTFYSLSDSYYQNIHATDIYFPEGLDNNNAPIDLQNDFSETPDGNYDYNLSTPFKLQASAAIVFGKSGLISAEYEFTDYSMMSLSSNSGTTNDFYNENNLIGDLYGAAHSIKLGTELQLSNYFRLRGGTAYYTSPLTNSGQTAQLDRYNDLWTVSGGFGYRSQGFFFDVSYVYRNSDSDNFFYGYNDPENEFTDILSSNKAQNHLLSFTLGFKF